MRVAETNVYKFSELSDSAKENAREWMRQAESSSFDPDSAYEDLHAIASIMGIEIAQRRSSRRFAFLLHDALHLLERLFIARRWRML